MWWICLFLIFGYGYAGPASQPVYHSQYVGAQSIPAVQFEREADLTYNRNNARGLREYSTTQADKQSVNAQYGGPLYLQQIVAAQRQAEVEVEENIPVVYGKPKQYRVQATQQAAYESQKYVPTQRNPPPASYKEKLRQQAQEEEEENDPNPSYQFGFDVKDDLYTNYQNRKEQKEGNVITGSYSVVDSDGFLRTVTYTADPKEGFKAEVSRMPTNIVVKIPKQYPPEFERRRPEQKYAPQVAQSKNNQQRPTGKENARENIIYRFQK